jgi:hypothetical protein
MKSVVCMRKATYAVITRIVSLCQPDLNASSIVYFDLFTYCLYIVRLHSYASGETKPQVTETEQCRQWRCSV